MSQGEARFCPKCQSQMAEDAVLCVQCGYHLGLGRYLNEPPPEVTPGSSEQPAAGPSLVSRLRQAWECQPKSRRRALAIGGAVVVVLLLAVLALPRGGGPGRQADPETPASPDPSGEVAVTTPAPTAAAPVPVLFPANGQRLLFHEKVAVWEKVAETAPLAQLEAFRTVEFGPEALPDFGSHERYLARKVWDARVRGYRRFWPTEAVDDPTTWRGQPYEVVLGMALAGRKEILAPLMTNPNSSPHGERRLTPEVLAALDTDECLRLVKSPELIGKMDLVNQGTYIRGLGLLGRNHPRLLADLLGAMPSMESRYPLVEALAMTQHASLPKLTDELVSTGTITTGMRLVLLAATDEGQAEQEALDVYWAGKMDDQWLDWCFVLRHLTGPAMESAFVHSTESLQGARARYRAREHARDVSNTARLGKAAENLPKATPPEALPLVWATGIERLVNDDALLGLEEPRNRAQRWVRALFVAPGHPDQSTSFRDPVQILDRQWTPRQPAMRADLGMPMFNLPSPLHPLVLAAWRGDAKWVARLAEREENLRLAGSVALCYAVARHDRPLVEQLLASGVPVNRVACEPGINAWNEGFPRIFFSPLHVALERSDLALAEFLLAKGADINANSVVLRPVLQELSFAGSDEAFAFALAHGADPNLCGHGQGQGSTALGYLMEMYRCEAVPARPTGRWEAERWDRLRKSMVPADPKELFARLCRRAGQLLEAGADRALACGSLDDLLARAKMCDMANRQRLGDKAAEAPSLAELLTKSPAPPTAGSPERAAKAIGDYAADQVFQALAGLSSRQLDQCMKLPMEWWQDPRAAAVATAARRRGARARWEMKWMSSWPPETRHQFLADLAADGGLMLFHGGSGPGAPLPKANDPSLAVDDRTYLLERLVSVTGALAIPKPPNPQEGGLLVSGLPPVATQAITTACGRWPQSHLLWLDDERVAVLYTTGRIEVYEVAGMTLVQEAMVNCQASDWTLTKQGIVVAPQEEGPLQIVDMASFAVNEGPTVPGALTSLRGNAGKEAFFALNQRFSPHAQTPDLTELVQVDLAAGKVKAVSAELLSQRVPATAKAKPFRLLYDIALSPDGDTLFLLADVLHMFRWQNNRFAYLGYGDCAQQRQALLVDNLPTVSESGDATSCPTQADTIQVSSDGAYVSCVLQRSQTRTAAPGGNRVFVDTAAPGTDPSRQQGLMRGITATSYELQAICLTATQRPVPFPILAALTGGPTLAMGHGCGLIVTVDVFRPNELRVLSAWGSPLGSVPLPGPLNAQSRDEEAAARFRARADRVWSNQPKNGLVVCVPSPDGRRFMVLYGNRLMRLTPTGTPLPPGSPAVDDTQRVGPWMLRNPPLSAAPREEDIALPDLDFVLASIPGYDHVWVGRHPVTNAQYDAFLRDTGQTPLGGNGDEPVTNVDLYGAQRFCRWLNLRLGKAGRLPPYCEVQVPTRALWDAYARCGTARPFPWGDSLPPRQGNFAAALGVHDPWPGVAPVTALPPNNWGLCGVGSNVREWTVSKIPGPQPMATAHSYLLVGTDHADPSLRPLPILSRWMYQFHQPRDVGHERVGFRVVLCAPTTEWGAFFKDDTRVIVESLGDRSRESMLRSR